MSDCVRVPGSLAWWCAAVAAEAVAEVDATKPSDVVFAAVYDALAGNDPSVEEESPRPEWLGGDAANVPDPVTKLLFAVDRLRVSAEATWGEGAENWPMGISVALGDVIAAADRLQVDLPGICGLRGAIVRLRRLLARAERQREEVQAKAPYVHLVEREATRLRHERDERIAEVAQLRAALMEIAKPSEGDSSVALAICERIAKTALGGEGMR